MSGMMPFYILREWDNDGKLLSGGKVYFYESGTYVPKAVYTDSTMLTPLPNPVILDASGSCDIWLGDGAYRVLIRDQYDVQVKPAIDGVFGSGSSQSGSNASFSTVKVYDDLRMLPLVSDFVYVTGRVTEGDGGAGWFQYIPGSTLVDNDGTVLASGAGANVYSRVFDAAIDPRWFGVRYGIAVDNKTYLDHAFTASALYNYPVQLAGNTFLAQNITVPTGASLVADLEGYFVASSTIVVTFDAGSKLVAEGRTFSTNVSVVINADVCPAIPVSWMGGAIDDDRLTKLLASGTTSIPLVIDQALTGIGNVVTTKPMQFVPGIGSIAFSNSLGLTISIPGIVPVDTRMFTITDTTVITAIDFGSRYAKPEWFGATGLIADNAYRQLYYCLKTGKMELGHNRTYSALTTFPALPASLHIRGNDMSTLNLAQYVGITTTSLVIRNISVTLASAFNWLTCSVFTGFQANFPSTYTATVAQEIDGCGYTDKPFGDVPVYNGRPQLYNAHLPLILNAESLRTDGVGKIYASNNISEFNSEFNLKNITTQSANGDIARVKGFFETDTLICYTNGQMGYWYRAKNDPNGLWVFSSVTIPTMTTSTATVQFMNWHAGRWYALTECTNGGTWFYEVFSTTNPASTWTKCTGDGIDFTGTIVNGWTNCVKNKTTGSIYASFGYDSVYSASAIIKIVGTTSMDQNAGYGREVCKIIAIDEVNDYLYINSYDLPGNVNSIINRKKMSSNAEQYVGIANYALISCGLLAGGDSALVAINGGLVGYLTGLLAPTFAPTLSPLQNPNMGNMFAMVNAKYTIVAGNDTGRIGVASSATTSRFFSNRLSGMEGASYNGSPLRFTAGYYLASNNEVLLGGVAGSVYTSVA